MCFRLLLLAVTFCSAGMLSGPASAERYEVSDVQALLRVWEDADAGDEILLAAGSYASVSLTEGGGAEGRPVTITSADPGNPALITSLWLASVEHVTFQEVTFDYRFSPADGLGAKPFHVSTVKDVTFRDVLFDGDIAYELDKTSNGFPAGFGLMVQDSENVTLEQSEIREFWRGIQFSRTRSLTVTENDLHSIRMDGMNFVQVEDVKITGNAIHDFKRSANSADHADMIQFWTKRTSVPSKNIEISGNLLNSGEGLFTQSIFMGNNPDGKNNPGKDMFYRNILIRNNLIINAHTHGISLGETLGVTIENNTLVHNPASDGERAILALYRPRLGVTPRSENVVIRNNVAAGYKLPDPLPPSWDVSGNVEVQDTARMKPYHYSMVFEGHDWAKPSSYLPKPAGPLDQSDRGADVGKWE